MEGNPDHLFLSLVHHGLRDVVGSQLPEIAEYLELLAATEGRADRLFLSEAVRAIDSFFREHDEYGGVRTGFVDRLSDLVRENLSAIERSDVRWASKLARDFRDVIRSTLATYDPANTYDQD